MNSENRDEELAQDENAIAAEEPTIEAVSESTAEGADEQGAIEPTREALAEAAEALGLDAADDAEPSGARAGVEPDGDDAENPESLDLVSTKASIQESEDSEELGEAPEAEPKEEIPELTEEEAGMLGKVLFALLFASPEPLSLGRLKDLTESPVQHVRAGLDALEEQVAASELPLILRSIAGGFRLFSAPEVADIVTRLLKVRKAEQISPAALETLAIVAYRQPTTKAEVEAIRGVQAGPMLRGLIDRGLVKVTGRADQPGSPLQYGTTREFLDRFGLENLKALPRDNELAGK